MADIVKHTPGPWKAVKAAHGPIDIFDPRGRDVVTVYGGGVEAESQSANARLIASAPELLLALQELLEAYSKPDERLCCDGRDCGCMGSTVHQQAEHYARVAIAKAEGRS
ncbi:hypothetical protein G6L74_06025 [Agrobacterium tumefaciens]|uniref:hypothetical protein n=1 Tax=Agrobacterium tumefaciens TaxID=358 RepID=UPI0015717E0D|nr:hypothetical protein [Agrobacterium tumefaciens]